MNVAQFFNAFVLAPNWKTVIANRPKSEEDCDVLACAR